METNHIFVNGEESRIRLALEETEHFAEYQNLAEKDALRLRLLTEELLGMIRGMAGEYKAMFWIEGGKTSCHLHLQAKVDMTGELRSELIAASTNKKNAAAVGFGGKLRNLIETGLQSLDDSSRLSTEAGSPVAFYSLGMDPSVATMATVDWSLARYKKMVGEEGLEEESAVAWDELEKSVLAKLADDIRVGIKKSQVDIVVDKNF